MAAATAEVVVPGWAPAGVIHRVILIGPRCGHPARWVYAAPIANEDPSPQPGRGGSPPRIDSASGAYSGGRATSGEAAMPPGDFGQHAGPVAANNTHSGQVGQVAHAEMEFDDATTTGISAWPGGCRARPRPNDAGIDWIAVGVAYDVPPLAARHVDHSGSSDARRQKPPAGHMCRVAVEAKQRGQLNSNLPGRPPGRLGRHSRGDITLPPIGSGVYDVVAGLRAWKVASDWFALITKSGTPTRLALIRVIKLVALTQVTAGVAVLHAAVPARIIVARAFTACLTAARATAA